MVFSAKIYIGGAKHCARIAGERVFMEVMTSALKKVGLKGSTPKVADGGEAVAEWVDEGGQDFVDDRPRILSDEAFKKRRQDIETTVAERQKNKNAKPFKRLVKVVHWDVLHDIFKGRETNPLTVAEYEAYRDKALAELPKDFGDQQFSREANNRVANSYFEDQLRRKVFHGRSNVGLLEVEQAIVALEQKGGKRRGLEADLDTLVTCGEKTGGGVCVGEFLPRCYLNRNEKLRGNYSPDMFDEKVLAVCPSCQEFLVGKLVERNKAIIAACRGCQELNRKDEDGRHNDHAADPKNMTAFVPRFLSKKDAEEVVERRMHAINLEKERLAEEAKAKQERDGSADRFIQKMVGRRNQQYIPETKRGQNKKGNNHRDRRRRDHYDD